MLSFSSDVEMFNWLMSVEFRESQFSQNELLYLLKRFREEYRKMEGRKRSMENDIFSLSKQNEELHQELDLIKKEKNFIDCKNTVLLKKFKNGLSLKERLTGKVVY